MGHNLDGKVKAKVEAKVKAEVKAKVKAKFKVNWVFLVPVGWGKNGIIK